MSALNFFGFARRASQRRSSNKKNKALRPDSEEITPCRTTVLGHNTDHVVSKGLRKTSTAHSDADRCVIVASMELDRAARTSPAAGLRPWRCDVVNCSERFRQIDDMSNHLLSRHGIGVHQYGKRDTDLREDRAPHAAAQTRWSTARTSDEGRYSGDRMDAMTQNLPELNYRRSTDPAITTTATIAAAAVAALQHNRRTARSVSLGDLSPSAPERSMLRSRLRSAPDDDHRRLEAVIERTNSDDGNSNEAHDPQVSIGPAPSMARLQRHDSNASTTIPSVSRISKQGLQVDKEMFTERVQRALTEPNLNSPGLRHRGLESPSKMGYGSGLNKNHKDDKADLNRADILAELLERARRLPKGTDIVPQIIESKGSGSSALKSKVELLASDEFELDPDGHGQDPGRDMLAETVIDQDRRMATAITSGSLHDESQHSVHRLKKQHSQTDSYASSTMSSNDDERKETEQLETVTVVREHISALTKGVQAPLIGDFKATEKIIPVGARWTRIDRRLVNPEALDVAQEPFLERDGQVIVLRVLTKAEIMELAHATKALRAERVRRAGLFEQADAPLYPRDARLSQTFALKHEDRISPTGTTSPIGWSQERPYRGIVFEDNPSPEPVRGKTRSEQHEDTAEHPSEASRAGGGKVKPSVYLLIPPQSRQNAYQKPPSAQQITADPLQSSSQAASTLPHHRAPRDRLSARIDKEAKRNSHADRASYADSGYGSTTSFSVSGDRRSYPRSGSAKSFRSSISASNNASEACDLSDIQTRQGSPDLSSQLPQSRRSSCHQDRRPPPSVRGFDKINHDYLDAHETSAIKEQRRKSFGFARAAQSPEIRYQSESATKSAMGQHAIEMRHSTLPDVPLDSGEAEASDGTKESTPADTFPFIDTTPNECGCSPEAQAGLESQLPVSHCFDSMASYLPTQWEDIRDELPETYKWDTEYERRLDAGSWTCMLVEDDEPRHVPLTIAGAPVVLPVRHHWPPIGGVNPPPDPRSSFPIDCRADLPLGIIRDIFLTFPGSVGFYLLINNLLQIIVPDTFDTTWASSHLPHKFGGLRVCYIDQTLEPTMQPTRVTTSSTNSSKLSQRQRLFSSYGRSQLTRELQLNDHIEARVSSTSRDRYSGRIGLKVTKEGSVRLLMSTHVIAEAIIGKSFLGIGKSRDHSKRLAQDWNQLVEIWAGNAKIGHIEKTYDSAAGIYPSGYCHDITVIKPASNLRVRDVKAPLNGLGWLGHEGWSKLRQQNSALRILGEVDLHRNTKCIKCNLPSEASVIGEGVFLNQRAAAGAKYLKDHDVSTWSRLVSRAVLYRISPDLDVPNGYSGIAVYTDGVREDGTYGPGVVGLQSFVQRSGHPQSFNMPEGPAMQQRLKTGRIAFYGAFRVPGELRRDSTIV